MRLTEKSAIVSLCSLLICLSVSAQIRLFEGNPSAPSPMESQIGFFLPFAAFALLSAYHYFEWARKHRFQAVLLTTCLVSFALLIGLASAIGNSHALGNAHSPPGVTFGELPPLTSQTSAPPPVGASAIEQNLKTLGETINGAPYMSTMLGAIEIGMSAIALAIIFFRGRYRRLGTNRSGNEKDELRHTPDLRRPPLTSRDIVVEEYLNTLRYFKVKGLSIPDSDTPDDAMRRVKQAWPDRSDPLRSLTSLYEEAKFSLHRIGEAQVNFASQLRVSITAEASKQ
jgi:Domain of unknown function (DUF4129)